MLLTLRRNASAEGATIGDLYVDGAHECFTCEDVVREVPGEPVSKWKVPGQTAIPVGKYRIVLTHSNHFNKVLPEVLNVPGYQGVRIHSGNTAKDTEGCILVGEDRTSNSVLRSREAMLELMALLTTVIEGGEQVWLEIEP